MAALEALARLHERYGHIQEVILQNFVPHQSYYGREPAQIADHAARHYWRTGVWSGPDNAAPRRACEVTIEDMKPLVREARRLLPDGGTPIEGVTLRLICDVDPAAVAFQEASFGVRGLVSPAQAEAFAPGRRFDTIARPARVRILSRNPCTRARRRLLGWKVRLPLATAVHSSLRMAAANPPR